jgi:hypothetical protein
MYLKQNLIEDILELEPRWSYICKYTNEYNIQSYILRGQIGSRDIKNIITMEYLSIPRFINNAVNTEVTFIFGISKMYNSFWGIHKKDEIYFLENYGLNYFKQILSQQKDPSSQEVELILTSSNPNELEPLFINGNLISPINDNDNLRLRYLTINNIYHYIINRKQTNEDFEQELRNECFVPDDIFNMLFEDFTRNDYFDIGNKSLTDKGKNYCKNIKDDPMFENLLKDKVDLIKMDGRTFKNIPASVQKEKIFFSDASLPIEEGDKIERKLPNNLVEIFIVIDRGYYESVGGISAHYQTKVVRESDYKMKNESKNVNYTIQGDNSRININSIDKSVNISTIEIKNLFENIKSTLTKNIKSSAELEIIIEKLDDLKESVGTNSFTAKYNNFIQSVAAHMTIIAPFLPALSQLLVM